jgi:hypothetical protein
LQLEEIIVSFSNQKIYADGTKKFYTSLFSNLFATAAPGQHATGDLAGTRNKLLKGEITVCEEPL